MGIKMVDEKIKIENVMTAKDEKQWHQTVFALYKKRWSILSDQEIADELEVDLPYYRSTISKIGFKNVRDKDFKNFVKKHSLHMGTISLENPCDFVERIRRKDRDMNQRELLYYYVQYISSIRSNNQN